MQEILIPKMQRTSSHSISYINQTTLVWEQFLLADII